MKWKCKIFRCALNGYLRWFFRNFCPWPLGFILRLGALGFEFCALRFDF